MPYIIVVNRPGFMPEQDPHAVATLDEARDHALSIVRDTTGIDAIEPMTITLDEAKALEHLASALPATGGIIGPLPDGYVIDVQHLPIMSLAARIAGPRDYTRGFSDAEIIAAFNGV